MSKVFIVSATPPEHVQDAPVLQGQRFILDYDGEFSRKLGYVRRQEIDEFTVFFASLNALGTGRQRGTPEKAIRDLLEAHQYTEIEIAEEES